MVSHDPQSEIPRVSRNLWRGAFRGLPYVSQEKSPTGAVQKTSMFSGKTALLGIVSWKLTECSQIIEHRYLEESAICRALFGLLLNVNPLVLSLHG